ncbi:MAG: TIGR00266 family protein [Candidatus Sumerlaeaceae bacterium]
MSSSGPVWYLAQNGQTLGPMSLDELVQRIPGAGGNSALVYGPGTPEWKSASSVPEVAARLANSGPGSAPPPPVPAGSTSSTQSASGKRSDEIDYKIHGGEMQYVDVMLDPGEMVIAEPGMMMYMTPGVKMDTVLGDPSAQNQGVMGKLLSAGKRALTGESLFVTTFTCTSGSREDVAFSAPYPGKLIPMHLDELGHELIVQRDAFVCAARGTTINIAFQKKIGVGLFGGEGFIMQRLTGDGVAIVHAGGNIMERTLSHGETLRVDTGCIVALQPSVGYDIQMVGGIKNTLFGGEGLFFATLTGPGRIWLQSLPFSRLAGRIVGTRGGAAKEEGSLLGGLLGGE